MIIDSVPPLLLATLFLTSLLIHANAQNTAIQTHQDYEYQFQAQNPLGWSDAESACAVWGGHLVSISTQEENDFVESLSGNSRFWTGLNDRLLNGQWMWSDPARRQQLAYTNWDTNEPSSDNNRDCAIMNTYADSKWEATYCDVKYPYVCKRRIGSCSWDDSGIGAPKPIVSTSFVDGEVAITAQVPSKNTTDVSYFLGFFRDFDVFYNLAEGCGGGNMFFGLPIGKWTVESHDCSKTMRYRAPMEEFLYDSTAQMQASSDIITLTTNLVVAYIDVDRQSGERTCDMTVFQPELSFRTLLKTDSTLSFHSNSELTPTYTSLSINSLGQLVMHLKISPIDENTYFSDFGILSHSKGYTFSANLHSEDCADEDNTESCTYELLISSEETSDGSQIQDFSGTLTLNYTYHGPWGNTTESTFSMLLSYVDIGDQILTNNLDTVVSLVDPNTFEPVDSFTPFEETTVLVKTDPPISMPQAKFDLVDAYLCCTKGKSQLAPYNPNAGNYGCTVRDDKTMSFWAQLVDGGEVNSEYLVTMTQVNDLVRDKVAFSFYPQYLFGDDRLCYIHARTELYLPEVAFKREVPASGERYISNSYHAVSIHSCSSETTEESCLSLSKYCDWDSTTKTCHNSHEQRESAASQAKGSSVFIGLLLVIGSFLILY